MLDDTYLREAEYRARRFSGAYTGTSGTLAADVIRLLNLIRHQRKEIDRMSTTLEEANDELRAAVEARLAQGCAADAAVLASPCRRPCRKRHSSSRSWAARSFARR